jgi:long-chain fatty acid transport protein
MVWIITFSYQAVASNIEMNGVKTMGMGSTFSGLNGAPEVAWMNPAALSTINEKFSLNFGAFVSWNSTKFQLKEPSTYQAVTDNPLKYPYFLNVSFSANDRLTFGLNINKSFSYHINWQDENWAGRFIVQSIDISSIAMQPSVSFQINDFLSAGAGIILSTAEFSFTRGIPVRDQNREGSMNVNGNSKQMGFNLGLFSTISDRLNLGLSYRSAIPMNFNDGNPSFLHPNSLQNYFPVNNSVNVVFPGMGVIDFTGGWKKSDLIGFAWGIAYSTIEKNENITFDFAQNTVFLPDYAIIRNDIDDLKIRMGVEYQAAEFLLLRAGSWYLFRMGGNDFVAPDKPQTKRLAMTSGTTFIPFPGLSFNLGFVFITGSGKEVNYAPANFAGIYKSYSFISGVGISYVF